MKLVTIIVNYKTPDMTLDAARAALKQLSKMEGEWKLFIVDNDSRDQSFELMQAAVNDYVASSEECWKCVEVVQSGHNGGFGAGNNYVINRLLESSVIPDYFYILNSDAFPEDQSIELLLRQFDESHDTGIVGSYIHGPDGEPHTTAFRFPTVYSELEGSIRLGLITKIFKKYVVPIGIPDRTQLVDWLAGASMMIRCEVLQQIGLFDESFFLYFEETDLCYRAKKAGWNTVYVRDSSVSHIGSVSTGMKSWRRIPEYWLDSRRLFFIKSYGRVYYWLATLVRILGELLWSVRVRLEGKRDIGPTKFLSDLSSHFFSGSTH